MGQVLVGVDDRSKALSYFLDGLNAADRAQLRRMLQRSKRAGG
jgi:hypothetical protein